MTQRNSREGECPECPYQLLCFAGKGDEVQANFLGCDLCNRLWVTLRGFPALRCSDQMYRKWGTLSVDPWVCPDCVWEAQEEQRREEEASMRDGINDEERRQWVDNDEGLYDLWTESQMGLYRWVRENRAIIDEVIVNVRDGAKPAHYLKYGGQRG